MAGSTQPAPSSTWQALCVGIATFGDLDGAWLTIQAIRLYHPEVADRTSFLVIDTDPATSAADAEALAGALPVVRYAPLPGGGAADVHDLVLHACDADVVCLLDSYTLIEPGGVAATLARFDEHPRSREPVEIARGCFAARRDAWPRLRPADPFACFDAIFCLNLDSETGRWLDAARRHARLGIAARVERFSGDATPDNPHRGIATSFRRMIAAARRRGYESVLVLEDDAVFLDDALAVMSSAAEELATVGWDLCYLGACVWSQEFPFLGDSAVLQACGAVTCTHAIAFHRRAYDRLLAELPTTADGLDRFLRKHVAIDQYLSHRIADGTYRAVITSPRVASQPNLLEWAEGDDALGARYVI